MSIPPSFTLHKYVFVTKYFKINLCYQVDDQANVSATTQGQLIGLNAYRDLFVGGYDIYEINFLPDDVDYTDGFRGLYAFSLKSKIIELII